MKETSGNIWDWVDRAKLVITTNVGWRSDGTNVMGAGLAKQAAQRYPGIAAWYGAWCRDHRSESCVVAHHTHPLIFFPTKRLNPDAPHLSWQYDSDFDTIRRSLADLAQWPGVEPIAVPLVGCQNGGLKEAAVLPVLREYLVSDRFVLVRFASPEPTPGVDRNVRRAP
jgi:hypothetical protein